MILGLSLSVFAEGAERARTTALHVAACQCDLAAMKAARASGADINGLDIDGNTPLHFAAGVRGEMSGSPLCVNRASVVNVADRCRAAIRYLVTSGGDVNKSNRFGEVPLHFAAQNPWAASERAALLVEDLLQFGADPNVANNEGNTPLHVANLYAHNRDVISTLIRHRAKVDLANDKGITPLMRAAQHGPDRATVADLILSAGADPDRKSPRGDAPLHIAIKFGGNVGKGTVVSVLLAANADPCVRDAQGYTPYQLSKGAIRQALSEAGGYDRSSPDGPGCPLSGEVQEEDQRAKDIATRREAQRIAREEADRVDKENAAAQQREDDADNLSDRDHEFIMGVHAIYPRRAQTRGVEGHVIVEYVVTATGAVVNPAVVEAEPPGIFERAAIQAVLQYKFRPRVVDGKAVDATGVRTRINFELEDDVATMEPSGEQAGRSGVGPEMVVIPAGRFRMGCVSGPGPDCSDDEKPVHEVTIPRAFVLSAREVTFAQWDACAAAGGCNGYRPDDEGWGRGNRPVINVTWEDAQSYVSWLSRETGEEFRLPSEAEWEYAARAGTATKYSWGNEIGSNRANCDNDYCGDQWEYTAPVGSFAPNAFGLYDMHGNVGEWVEDCMNESYSGAPSNGTAWLGGGCAERALRGGTWLSSPGSLRAAYRSRSSTGNRYFSHGFRVARTLTP